MITVSPKTTSQYCISTGPKKSERNRCAQIVPGLVASTIFYFAIALLSGCSWLEKVRGHPSLEAQSLMERAQQAEAEGDVKQAGFLLHQAIQANPEDAEGHCELARLLIKQGDVDAAIEQLQLATRQNPDDIESHVQLAHIQLEHKRLSGAEREIASALSIDPGHIDSLLMKAEVAEISGRDALAMETYYRVLSRQPENLPARLRLAQLQINAGRPDRAAPLLRAVCECPAVNDQQRGSALWSLGIAYGQQGRWQDTIRSLNAAIPHRREMTADDWYRLAYARYAAKDYGGAWSDTDRALQQQPNHRLALAMHGILQGTNGQTIPGRSNGLQRLAMAAPTPSGW